MRIAYFKIDFFILLKGNKLNLRINFRFVYIGVSRYIMKTVLKDIFETKIGNIEISINCETDCDNIKSDGLKTETLNHKIVIKTINLKNSKLPENMKIDSSKGWRIYIEKKTNYIEKLNVVCKLLNPTIDSEFNLDCGENLDAIIIANKNGVLHIGTEDGEIIKSRAELDNWFPKRLKNFISLENPITKFIDFGFESKIPDLQSSEKLYLHFLVATNYEINKGENNLENGISTWFAVEKNKTELDEEKKYIC
jgi:hypothetical protein